MPEVYNELIKRARSHYLRRLTNKQKETLRKFDEYNELKNLTKVTRSNQVQIIGHLGDDLKKDFEEMTKEDANQWLSRPMEPSSRQVYQLTLQKFFKWLETDIKGWFIKIENAGSKTIPPSSIWSPEEIDNLIRVYPEVQYRALVATLFDTEARVSEFCSMNIEDVEFIAGNAVFYFPESKTQKRRVPLIFSTKEVLPWYNLRKEQGKPTDPFWISKCNRTKNQRLSASGVTEILNYGRKLLGTKKRLHPHLLRHSMASYLRAKGLSDALHRIRMGLALNSPVLDRYTHFTDEQVSDGAKKAFGIKTDEPVKEEINPLLPRKCPRCGTLNRTSNTLCSKCFYSLDYENTDMEITILEMFRTEFAKATNLDILFNQYRYHKLEVNLLEHFKSLLQGNTVIETELVRQYFTNNFKLTEDQILEFLGTLTGEGVIEIVGDNILILGIEKLEDYIQKSKEFLRLGDKYATSKKGGE